MAHGSYGETSVARCQCTRLTLATAPYCPRPSRAGHPRSHAPGSPAVRPGHGVAGCLWKGHEDWVTQPLPRVPLGPALRAAVPAAWPPGTPVQLVTGAGRVSVTCGWKESFGKSLVLICVVNGMGALSGLFQLSDLWGQFRHLCFSC